MKIFKCYILLSIIFLYGSFALAGANGGMGGLEMAALKSMLKVRAIEGGGLVGNVSGSGTDSGAELNRVVVGNESSKFVADALIAKLSGQKVSIVEDAAIVSEYRTGDAKAFNIDWETQKVYFEDTTASFEEVTLVSEEIVTAVESELAQ